MNEILVIKVTFLKSTMLAVMNGYVIVIMVPSLKNKENLGRVFRPFNNEGNDMSQSIVASSG